YQEKKFVNGYVFIKTLSEELDSKSIIISDDGGHLTWTMQAFEVKKGQKLFSAFGNSPMGYSFPASIGASFALGKKEVICIDGDGSIQMNIQDFQTVVHHKLPLKIFVLNNDGYAILQQFQETWLGGRFVAASFNQGLSNPDLIKVAKAYGLKTVLIRNHQELRRKIRKVLKAKGPVFCEVKINPKQRLIPKLEFGNPLEDLSPHLSREEFKANMIIPPLAESLEVSPSV
ncbi:MAG: Thiamine pyrophosphate-requiring enzyme, partial [Parcubacteria group bacterium GW2011_GWA2_43_9b]